MNNTALRIPEFKNKSLSEVSNATALSNIFIDVLPLVDRKDRVYSRQRHYCPRDIYRQSFAVDLARVVRVDRRRTKNARRKAQEETRASRRRR